MTIQFYGSTAEDLAPLLTAICDKHPEVLNNYHKMTVVDNPGEGSESAITVQRKQSTVFHAALDNDGELRYWIDCSSCGDTWIETTSPEPDHLCPDCVDQESEEEDTHEFEYRQAIGY